MLLPPWDIPNWADRRLDYCCRFFEAPIQMFAYITYYVEGGVADVDITLQKYGEYWKVIQRKSISEKATFTVFMSAGEWVEPRIWDGSRYVKRIIVTPFFEMRFLSYVPGILLGRAIPKKRIIQGR